MDVLVSMCMERYILTPWVTTVRGPRNPTVPHLKQPPARAPPHLSGFVSCCCWLICGHMCCCVHGLLRVTLGVLISARGSSPLWQPGLSIDLAGRCSLTW